MYMSDTLKSLALFIIDRDTKLRGRLAAIADEIAALKEENSNLTAHNKSWVDKLHSDVAKLTEENTQLKADRANTAQHNASLRRMLVARDESVSRLHRDIETLKESNSVRSQANDSLRRNIADMEQQMAELSEGDQSNKYNDKVSELSRTIDNQSRRNARDQDRLLRYSERVKYLRQCIAAQAEMIVGRERLITALQAEVSELRVKKG